MALIVHQVNTSELCFRTARGQLGHRLPIPLYRKQTWDTALNHYSIVKMHKEDATYL
jgi:hypothetical protein